jgi:polar amino acid transport system substrate-binding protein
MRPLVKLFAASSAVTLGVSLLAGCGGGSTTPSGEASSSVKADSALAAKVPASVKKDGVITVGSDASYAPSEFLGADNKTVQGFDVDLFNVVAAKLGLKARFTNAKFDSIIPGVASGKYEMGVSSFTINADREKQVNMVSYYSAGTQWFTQKGNPSKVDPNNACGKAIAVQTNTVQNEDLMARSQKCTQAGKPAIKIDSYQGQDQATAAVVSGKDAAGLADSPVGAYAVKQTGDKLQLLGDIYESAPYGYVIPKDQADFAQAVAGAVDAVIKDGTYQKVLEKWGVQGGAITKAEVNPSAS